MNIPLLRKMVEWVEAESELPLRKRDWYQGAWTRKWKKLPRTFEMVDEYCGTNYCVAGKIAHDAGWVVTDPYEMDEEAPFYIHLRAEKDGEVRLIREIAASELGVPYRDADGLFAGWHSASDLRRVAEEMAGERL